MTKVKVHKFWISATSSVGTSKYKLFVAKSDYDRVVKELKKLKKESQYNKSMKETQQAKRKKAAARKRETARELNAAADRRRQQRVVDRDGSIRMIGHR